MITTSVIAGILVIQSQASDYTIVVPPARDQATTTLAYGSKPALENYSFFKEVEHSFREQNAEFISVDLDAMELSLYRDGKVVLEMEIAAKGRRGSWWETPPGLYKIQTKERDHVTSFGGLHMPWSMQFNGNFFIHGWPYFPDGRDVTGDASAGCIRLTQENAQKLFAEVSIGIPVLVYDDRSTGKDVSYALSDQGFSVSADQFLVADLQSNQVLAEQDMKESAPASSLTYLLTALVASEHYGLENSITQVIDGKNNGPYRTYDLLHAMLQGGSDSSADALARYRGAQSFVDSMNERAAAIGMESSSFRAPGISPQNTTTPRDVFVLAKHIHNYRSFLLQIGRGDVGTSLFGIPRLRLENRNAFTGLREFSGGIVQQTNSGDQQTNSGDQQAALGIFTLRFGEEERPIAFVVANSLDPVQDIEQMYEHVKQRYTLRSSSELSAAHDRQSRPLSLPSFQKQKASLLDAVKYLVGS
ncbi:MAG: L,D-transpeptidase family protein [Candidatus Paceibacterota bacterium]